MSAISIVIICIHQVLPPKMRLIRLDDFGLWDREDGHGDIVVSRSGLSPTDWGEVRMLIESHANSCATEGEWGM
jgi:hypothetical protein